MVVAQTSARLMRHDVDTLHLVVAWFPIFCCTQIGEMTVACSFQAPATGCIARRGIGVSFNPSPSCPTVYTTAVYTLHALCRSMVVRVNVLLTDCPGRWRESSHLTGRPETSSSCR